MMYYRMHKKYISDLKVLKGDETAYVKKRHLVTQFATDWI